MWHCHQASCLEGPCGVGGLQAPASPEEDRSPSSGAAGGSRASLRRSAGDRLLRLSTRVAPERTLLWGRAGPSPSRLRLLPLARSLVPPFPWRYLWLSLCHQLSVPPRQGYLGGERGVGNGTVFTSPSRIIPPSSHKSSPSSPARAVCGPPPPAQVHHRHRKDIQMHIHLHRNPINTYKCTHEESYLLGGVLASLRARTWKT